MPAYDVAHLREQGQNMIIVPLDRQFEHKPSSVQHEFVSELQFRAQAAGLAGTVVPVWESGGYTKFIAPHPWHPFFKGVSLRWVARNVNKRISW